MPLSGCAPALSSMFGELPQYALGLRTLCFRCWSRWGVARGQPSDMRACAACLQAPSTAQGSGQCCLCSCPRRCAASRHFPATSSPAAAPFMCVLHACMHGTRGKPMHALCHSCITCIRGNCHIYCLNYLCDGFCLGVGGTGKHKGMLLFPRPNNCLAEELASRVVHAAFVHGPASQA